MSEAHRCIIGTNNKLINLVSLINVESVLSELSKNSFGDRREDLERLRTKAQAHASHSAIAASALNLG